MFCRNGRFFYEETIAGLVFGLGRCASGGSALLGGWEGACNASEFLGGLERMSKAKALHIWRWYLLLELRLVAVRAIVGFDEVLTWLRKLEAGDLLDVDFLAQIYTFPNQLFEKVATLSFKPFHKLPLLSIFSLVSLYTSVFIISLFKR